MPGRRIAFLSMSIETLLEVVAGRAKASLPLEIPPDSAYLYSYVEHDTQTLKIAITHAKLEEANAAGYSRTYKIIAEKVESPKDETVTYSGESLLKSDNWHRDV